MADVYAQSRSSLNFMQRYAGEALASKPHIVVLGSCKVGNFVVSTPVLRGLKSRFVDCTLGFIGSEVTGDFERAHDCIDWRVSWDAPGAAAGLTLLKILADQLEHHGPVQLAVNLDGFNPLTCTLVPWLEPRYVVGGSLDVRRRNLLPWGDLPQQQFLADSDWDSPEFLQRYEGVFGSNYIAELFCHLAFVDQYSDPTCIDLPHREPDFDVPDVLIHVTTARAAKIWPADQWLLVLQWLSRHGFTVGLVGSAPSVQRDAYNSGVDEDWLLAHSALIDLRGRTSLIQLAGAALRARAVVSVDAGPLHIAAAMGTPTLAVVGNDALGRGASPIRLWLPRCASVSRTVSEISCTLCADNRFKNNDCLATEHLCMQGVTSAQVVHWLSSVLQSP
jgi:ADP-heptose:LPS heptosyltransferase